MNTRAEICQYPIICMNMDISEQAYGPIIFLNGREKIGKVHDYEVFIGENFCDSTGQLYQLERLEKIEKAGLLHSIMGALGSKYEYDFIFKNLNSAIDIQDFKEHCKKTVAFMLVESARQEQFEIIDALTTFDSIILHISQIEL
ncbi:MAG: hypothetical protein IT244_10025 [Bacteroidia bacterium]|nr:hypothetical protein [Bacteroidia bacterium]